MQRTVSPSGQEAINYRRARWKHWSRYAGLFIMMLLNYSLIMSTIADQAMHNHFPLGLQIITFITVIFFDLTLLLPIIFEIDSLWITPDYLEFNVLFWRSKLVWNQIAYIHNPIYSNFAILRSPKCIYLINKRDIKPFDEVFEIIKSKCAKSAR